MDKVLNKPFKVKSEKISGICDRLNAAINQALNQDWFYKVSEDLSIDIKNLPEIMELFAINSCLYNTDFSLNYNRLLDSSEILKDLITRIKIFLLPFIKEKLGISCLMGNTPDKKSREFIYYSFIAYAFPVNLQKVESVLEELNQELDALLVPRDLIPYAKHLH